MKKKTIFWLSLITIVCAFIGTALLLGSARVADSCDSAQLPAGICRVLGAEGHLLIRIILLGSLQYLIAGVLFFITWIGALRSTTKMQAWGWVAVVYLLPLVGALIYSIAGPEWRGGAEGVKHASPPSGYR